MLLCLIHAATARIGAGSRQQAAGSSGSRRSRGVKMLESHWSNTKNTVLLFVENATSSALIGWKVRDNCRRAFDWSRRNSP